MFVAYAIVKDGETQRYSRAAPAGTTYADAFQMAQAEAARVGGTVLQRESGIPDVAVLTFTAEPLTSWEEPYWKDQPHGRLF